jgi:glucuronoarabinoxylan endo-1,4-beta-xylanase
MKYAWLWLCAAGLGGCSSDASEESLSEQAAAGVALVTPPASTQVVAQFSQPKQAIDGFGASESFVPTITDAQADLFFSTTSGIGLSMLRLGIAPNGTLYSGSWGTAQKALARNSSLFVWGTPWSPPAADKSTGSTTSGTIVASAYPSWASVLAGFAKTARANGVPVAAISAQNEPDFNTNGAYDMCLYDQNQMTSFVKVLGRGLAALNPPVQLLMPEPTNWNDLWTGPDYVDTVEADSTAAGYVGILATHQYAVTDPPAHALPQGKRLWETEMSDFMAFDPTIAQAITVASWIHYAMLDGGVSAWHYWWLVGQNADNEGLIGNKGDGSLTKRVYAMGNFSRFVRPGWTRFATTGSVSGLLVSAYANLATGDFVLVAINTTGSSISASFGVAGAAAFASVAPYVTSGTTLGNLGTDGNLSQGSASAMIPPSLAATSNAFTASVPPGVVTFVGKTTCSCPSGQKCNSAGTCVASVPAVPPGAAAALAALLVAVATTGLRSRMRRAS